MKTNLALSIFFFFCLTKCYKLVNVLSRYLSRTEMLYKHSSEIKITWPKISKFPLTMLLTQAIKGGIIILQKMKKGTLCFLYLVTSDLNLVCNHLFTKFQNMVKFKAFRKTILSSTNSDIGGSVGIYVMRSENDWSVSYIVFPWLAKCQFFCHATELKFFFCIKKYIDLN